MSRYPEISADDPMVVSIAALVRAELEQEAAAAFPTLSRIPSSGIIRHLDYLATLIALGRERQLPGHLNRALDNGVTKQEISEIITHLAFYAGWPAAMTAAQIAKDVFATR